MEEVMRLHAQVERARQDAMKAKEELEVWKMRDKERRLGLEAWWTRAREELDIFVADVSQSEHQETVNEEQPLVREEDETLSFRPFHPLSGSLQFPASREESVRRVRSFSTPHSRPTMSPPAVQTYGVELLPADPVEIDGRASVPNSEALSTVGDTFLSKLATRRGGGEYSKAFSMAGSGSITGGGGAEHSGSTLGDVEWSGFHTYTIGTPPAEQIRFDHRPPEPVRRRSSFHGRSGTKTPPPQLAPPPPPPRQAHPSPLIQRTRPSNSFIPAAKSEDGDIALPPSLQHNIGKRLPPRPQQGVGGENRRKEHTSAKGKERDMGPRYNQQGVILPPNNGVGVGFESSDPPLGSYFQPGEREDSRRNSGSYSIVSVQPLVDAWGVPIQMKDPKTQKTGFSI
ncbi:hypothetical protein GYMLUDRAFT_49548 [Collybiopsis luxurians FD-317 M1]|uniref:Uncharacterized protein n=1 Tax=Collybiopsis luxurians FD-317 M1 TaxID=944289 RepID=A0A0D0CE19_9AGAR|nr:hypothetical protein GYMLUDRAFT_49548 [Collybiopsis luxurians FD-317 M1]